MWFSHLPDKLNKLLRVKLKNSPFLQSIFATTNLSTTVRGITTRSACISNTHYYFKIHSKTSILRILTQARLLAQPIRAHIQLMFKLKNHCILDCVGLGNPKFISIFLSSVVTTLSWKLTDRLELSVLFYTIQY